MKVEFKILFFLIIILTSCRKNKGENSQTDSFMDSNNLWYIAEYPDYCRGCARPHKIELGKDTIINNYTYKPIQEYSGDSIESRITHPNVFGYIRETIDKKVYWYIGFNGSNPSDKLLFNFNAKINDTIDSPDGVWIVKKIDSLLIGNKIKKRLTLESMCGLDSPLKYWIEDIGDMSDMYNSPSCISINGNEYFISGSNHYVQTCFLKGGNLIIKESFNINCWVYRRLNVLN